MKNRLFIGLVFFCVALLLSPVISKDRQEPLSVVDSEKKTTISVLHYFELKAKRTAIKALTDAIVKKHPEIDFEIEGFEYGKYLPFLKTRIAAGNAPDIFEGKPRQLSELAKAGQFLSLTEKPYRKNIRPLVFDECSIDGVVYGIPLSIEYYGIYYNRSLFDKYSILVPTTFSQLMTACEIFQKNGVIPFVHGSRTASGIFIGFAAISSGMLVQEKAGDLYMKVMNKRAKFVDFPVFRDALTAYNKVLCYGDPSDFGIDEKQRLLLIGSGERPMYISSSRITRDLYGSYPQRRFAFFPVPWANDPARNGTLAVPEDILLVSAQSNKTAVIDKVMNFVTSMTGAAIWTELTGSFSAVIDTVNGESNDIIDSIQSSINTTKIIKNAEMFYLEGGCLDSFNTVLGEWVSSPSNERNVDTIIKQLDLVFSRISINGGSDNLQRR